MGMNNVIRTICTQAFAFIIVILAPAIVYTSGWSDYELDIGDGFKIVRCNALDVCLANSSNELIYHPDIFDSTGPIVAYSVSPKVILLRTFGRTPRNHFPGDTFQIVDTTQEFFLIYDRGTSTLSKPLSANDPSVTALGSIDWMVPRNPNPTLPIAFTLVFIAIIAIVIGGPLVLACIAASFLYRWARGSRPTPEIG